MFEKPVRVVLALAVLVLANACSRADHPSAAFTGTAGAAPAMPTPNVDPCETPNTGCSCDTADEVVDCGQVKRRSGDYVSCSMGKRTCDGATRTWGDCIGDRVATISVSSSQQQVQDLGTSVACTDNPCDPYCQRFVDDSNGLTIDAGVFALDAGLVLKANTPLPSTGTGCTGLVMTPATQAVTISAVNTAYVKGEYFNQYSNAIASIPSTWPVTATRTEPNIDYNWNSGAPGPVGIASTHFSVRWTGAVIPTTTESYTFYTITDDGVRLWINGTLVIDHWVDQGGHEVRIDAHCCHRRHSGAVPLRILSKWRRRLCPPFTGAHRASLSRSSQPANMAAPDGTRARLTVTPAKPTV